MTITLELTPQQEARLRARAARQGADVQAYALQHLGLLDTEQNDITEEPLTGAQLLAQLQADGVIGAWADRDDIGESADFARQLRTEAESRYEITFAAKESPTSGGRSTWVKRDGKSGEVRKITGGEKRLDSGSGAKTGGQERPGESRDITEAAGRE